MKLIAGNTLANGSQNADKDGIPIFSANNIDLDDPLGKKNLDMFNGNPRNNWVQCDLLICYANVLYCSIFQHYKETSSEETSMSTVLVEWEEVMVHLAMY